MDACSNYIINYSGKKQDAEIIKQELDERGVQSYILRRKSFVIKEDYEIVYASSFSDFAKELAKCNPEMDFSIVGETKCNSSAETQNFEYVKQGSTLIEQLTDWYNALERREEEYSYEKYIIGKKQTLSNPTEKTPEQIKSEWKYTILDDGSVCLDDFLGVDSSIIVPQEIESHPVSEIGEGAFSPGVGLFGDVLRKIPKGQKKVRNAIKEVNLPNSLRIIGKSAFEWSTIESIIIPDSVISIEDRAFKCCKNLNAISFGNGLKKIGKEAFFGIHEVLEWFLPDGLTHIAEAAFGYSSIYKIHVPRSVIEIGDHAIGPTSWSPKPIICGEPGSISEQYAEDNGLEFVNDDVPNES